MTAFGRAVLSALFAVLCQVAIAQESGYQVIQGTRVFTQIDHQNSRATFSNDCGSQTLTQSELQGGAIPSDIIPCPRPQSRPRSTACPDDYRRASNGKCIPFYANECSDGSYCEGEQKCSAGGGCIPVNSTDCGHGSYCPMESYCLPGGKCLPAVSPRVCEGGNKFCGEGTKCGSNDICMALDAVDCGQGESCAAGKVCDLAHHLCHSADDPASKAVALVFSTHGTFFGIATAVLPADAEAEAQTVCEAQQRNLASNTDERAESCRRKLVKTYACVAFARAHDYPYGKPEVLIAEAGTGTNIDEANTLAMNACKSEGGTSCRIGASLCSDTNK